MPDEDVQVRSNEYAEEVLAEQAVAVPSLLAPLAGIDEANTTQLNIKHRLGVAAPPLAANHAARRRDKNQEAKIHSGTTFELHLKSQNFRKTLDSLQVKHIYMLPNKYKIKSQL